ncbi:hypothetical protein SAMN02745751_03447 [Dethiosulfatibacter aminovorans DSM 17477]|uniref:Uncharacterized protein n=1 Tax=Dethiosulfatibacter aminovorans DSM 17477 TaxID=1121476 RepID=A0A1M6ME98_9FIRM|nr:hypothetical protein [Dethiosulfatibacter aminovorans]SHJ81764.1 hypothetical protein SAMN02745751_03447 [Dethiosulfatibacter aminovorans DSM 17477]
MKCDRCKKNDVRIIMQGIGNYCLDCSNEIMAEELGIDLLKEFNNQLTVIDELGKEHVFEIKNYLMPHLSKWLAVEEGGYVFEVLVGTHDSQQSGLEALKAKIVKALSYKSLRASDNRHFIESNIIVDDQQYGLKSIGTGTIYADAFSGDADDCGIVIDGKYVSFSDFGRMTSAFEGFVLEYQFRDAADEPLGKNMALKKVDVSKEAVIFRFDRYQRWLLIDDELPRENENEYLQVMKECIDDLDLMIMADFRDECRQVAEHMKSKLEKVETESSVLIIRLLDEIDRITWFLFMDE